MVDRTLLANKPIVEEVHLRDSQVYICLVVNRRHKSARIVDFLAGNFPAKQAAIYNIAHREGIERVYTLVEREESTGWAKAGYAREGSIPGYYKRSDAHLMGHLIHSPPMVDEDGNAVAPTADMNTERTGWSMTYAAPFFLIWSARALTSPILRPAALIACRAYARPVSAAALAVRSASLAKPWAGPTTVRFASSAWLRME